MTPLNLLRFAKFCRDGNLTAVQLMIKDRTLTLDEIHALIQESLEANQSQIANILDEKLNLLPCNVQCLICYEEKQCDKTPCCNHEICSSCSTRLNSTTCPFCRQDITSFVRERRVVEDDSDSDIEFDEEIMSTQTPTYRERRNYRYQDRNEYRRRRSYTHNRNHYHHRRYNRNQARR